MSHDDINTTLVIGAGIMGAGIAQNFAQSGLTVKVLDISTDALADCEQTIAQNLQAFEKFELLNEDIPTIANRISFRDAGNLVAHADDCDFVVEAMPELLELKQKLFGDLDGINTNAIIASNTSSMTISTLASEMSTADRLIGLHYFNPAHIIPAVEVHTGKDTSNETIERTMTLMKRVGKKPVRVRKEVPGFIINRLTGAMEREIDYLLDEGVVTPEDLDIAVKASYGFRLACLGPMEAEDMIGLDTAARASANLFPTLSNSAEPSPGIFEKVERGELGIKSGKGWYDYPDDAKTVLIERNNTRLLQQLKIFNSREGSES